MSDPYSFESFPFPGWTQVIRADRPCHLYFDLEFSHAANPGVDGTALVDLVVMLVRRMFW